MIIPALMTFFMLNASAKSQSTGLYLTVQDYLNHKLSYSAGSDKIKISGLFGTSSVVLIDDNASKKPVNTNTNDSEIKKAINYYKYSLSGVIVHTGTADSGHYYSIIKKKLSQKAKYSATTKMGRIIVFLTMLNTVSFRQKEFWFIPTQYWCSKAKGQSPPSNTILVQVCPILFSHSPYQTLKVYTQRTPNLLMQLKACLKVTVTLQLMTAITNNIK